MNDPANKMIDIPGWMQKQDIHQSDLPQWLNDLRLQHWNAFNKNGLPSRKHERWKYTDIDFLVKQNFSNAKNINLDELADVIHQHRLQSGESILIVMVNGKFFPSLSDIHKFPDEVIVCKMSKALQQYEDIIKTNLPTNIDAEKYPFACLNSALFVDGLFLNLPDSCELSVPVHLLSLVIDEDEFISHPHNIITLGKHSKLTLVEEHFSLVEQTYMMNIVTTINVEENAKLEHFKLQQEGKKAVHMANHFIRQKQHSTVSHVNISTGSMFARDDLIIQLLESGADCHTGGFYHLRDDNQYIDNHVDIDHAAPQSNSDMLYKGILEKKSKAVFNGRLHVEKDAQKILAYQENHNLLLSDEAEVYSKPELEIYADDVKCKHGATTGQLDQDALFYLRSRGIPKEEAISILLQGFAEDILQRITHTGIKMRVQEML